MLKPVKKLPIIKKKNVIYKNIKKILKKNKKLWIPITLLTLSYFIFNLICTLHFKYLMQLCIHYQITTSLYWISFLMLLFYFFKNTNLFLKNLLLNKWTSIFDYETTSITYKQVLLLPYLYYKNRTTGEIVSRFKDLNIIRSFISNFFCILSTDLVSVFLFFFFMFKYQVTLSYIILLLSSFFLIFTLSTVKIKKKQIKRVSYSQDKINSYLINGTNNVDTIKGVHFEKRLIDKFSLAYRSFLEKIYDYNSFLEFSAFIKRNINDLLLVIIYGIGSYYVIQEKLSLENFIIYQTFLSYFNNSFSNIVSLVEEYSSYKVSLERVEELFMITTDNFDNNYFYLPYHLNGDIHYHNLNYQMGSKVLFKNLNLTIKQGEKVLLSGESGSGKSTLLKMLLRYIEVEYGTISINQIDINHYHLENIRSYITYVTNKEYLFNDTLKNNILLYKDIEEEKFQEVCQLCMVDDIIKNNLLGYDTLTEEDGFNFSNGERQRIILARSLLRTSSIYIFDEALSGIDVAREKKILENIFHYLPNKTVIVISHRSHNKKVFDRILKLEGGTIHENS